MWIRVWPQGGDGINRTSVDGSQQARDPPSCGDPGDKVV